MGNKMQTKNLIYKKQGTQKKEEVATRGLEQSANKIKVQMNENTSNKKTETPQGDIESAGGKHRVASQGIMEQSNEDMSEKQGLYTHTLMRE